MTTTPTTFGRSARYALLAVLSTTLLAACGGGDDDAAEPDAPAATGQGDTGAEPALSLEAASEHASRLPAGGGQQAPICTHAPLDCQPNVPPTQ